MVNLLLFPALLTITTLVDKKCVSPSISLNEKLKLIGDDNDHDKNQIIDSADITYDVDNFYDYNKDKVVTETEWVAHWMCAYGDTEYMSRFVFNKLSGGKAEIRSSDFSGEPLASGIPRDAFITRNRGRYQEFKQYDCVNTDWTLDQKLDLIVRDNNHNNDDRVNFNDIEYDVNNRYDLDGDGMVNQAEWVLHWSCRYGDSAAYARYVWGIFSGGHPSIRATDFDIVPYSGNGVTVATFRSQNEERYGAFAALKK